MLKQTIRIVNKRSYDEQHFFEDIPTTSSELATSSVRVQAQSLAVTANNLSYCALGDALHWFDIYPLPPKLPGPYNNASEYAISPGWGYFKVLETTVPELAVGTMLYGMIPTSSMVTDLTLAPTPDAPGHWTAINPHRKNVMSMYNRYIVADADFAEGVDEVARLWKIALPWSSSYILNRYVFSSRPEDPAISPFPARYRWTRADADLSGSIIVTLGSGSKTCRAFIHQLATDRAQNSGPLALYEVTGRQEAVKLSYQTAFKHKVISYSDVVSSAVLEDIISTEASRVLVIDFGGRGGTVEDLTTQLRKALPERNVALLNVGNAPKVNNANDIQARMARAARLQAFQMNATDIIDGIIAEIGEHKTYALMEQEWQRIVSSQLEFYSGTPAEGSFLGMRLDIRQGVRGGLESAWQDICQGKATGETACVVQF